jgi:hypothetical protein
MFERQRGQDMRMLNLFGLPFALAVGVFVLTMLKDPSKRPFL